LNAPVQIKGRALFIAEVPRCRPTRVERERGGDCPPVRLGFARRLLNPLIEVDGRALTMIRLASRLRTAVASPAA
jgi:hypothetical protein